jgi:uncharacterized cupredoxin-like copper-binding protein
VLWRLVILGVVAVPSFLLGACGGDGAQEATTRIEVTGTNGLAFEPDTFTVPAGEEVTVVLTSEDLAPHDFLVEGVNGGGIHVVYADAGGTATGTFTISEPGTYEVFCSVPGHLAAGMEGTLTVVGR